MRVKEWMQGCGVLSSIHAELSCGEYRLKAFHMLIRRSSLLSEFSFEFGFGDRHYRVNGML